MTATDPPGDVTLPSEGVAARVAPTAHGTGVAADVRAADESAADDQAVLRIANLPRDVGWLMISVGVLGVILPGIAGTPFLAAGIAVLAPGGPRLLTRWARSRPNGAVVAGLKQIGRWVDDLERRYPRSPAS